MATRSKEPKCNGKTSQSCGMGCISREDTCRSNVNTKESSFLIKLATAGTATKDFAAWKPIAKGAYGQVSVSPDGSRVVKTALSGKTSEAFGAHEVAIATSMGKLGFSPEIYSSSESHIEMAKAAGSPIWATFVPDKGAPSMTAVQASTIASAFTALHKSGFSHGDAHSQQFMVDGDKVQMLDFGLSKTAEESPRTLIQDFNKVARLVNWDNPELDSDANVQRIRKYRALYKEAKGGKAAKLTSETEIALQYYKELKDA